VEVVDKWDFYLQHNFKHCAAAIIITNHKLFIFVFLPFFFSVLLLEAQNEEKLSFITDLRETFL